jgi:hypothetical protein
MSIASGYVESITGSLSRRSIDLSQPRGSRQQPQQRCHAFATDMEPVCIDLLGHRSLGGTLSRGRSSRHHRADHEARANHIESLERGPWPRRRPQESLSTWCLSSWAKNAKRAKSAWHTRQRELVATACGSKPLATARHSPPRVEDCTTCSPPNPDCASAGGFRTEVADGWARASPPYLYIRTCVAIHIGSDDRCYVG